MSERKLGKKNPQKTNSPKSLSFVTTTVLIYETLSRSQ